MDFWRTVSVVGRRWYVALPAFLVSMAVAGAVYASVPRHYVSNSILLLTIPTTGGSEYIQQAESDKRLTNPLLNFDRGLSTTAGVIIQAMTTPEMAQQLGVTDGAATTYKVTNGGTNPELAVNGPFVFIEGDSEASPAQAQDIVAKVAARAKIELNDRQKALGAPESTYITMTDVMPPTTPDAKTGGRMRAAGVVGVVGLLGGLVAAFAAESFVEARRTRTPRAGRLEPATSS